MSLSRKANSFPGSQQNSPLFMETECSLPYSQESTSGFYSVPHTLLYFAVINFDFTRSSTSVSS
jgi:hypothetical protein